MFDQFPAMLAIAKAQVTTGMRNMTNDTSETVHQVTERLTMETVTVQEVMVLEAMVSEVMEPGAMAYTRMDQTEPVMEPTVTEQITDLKVMVLQAMVLVPKLMEQAVPKLTAQVTVLGHPKPMAQVMVRIPTTEAAMVMEIIPMETEIQPKGK